MGLSPKEKDNNGLTPFLAALQSNTKVDIFLLTLLLEKSGIPLNDATFTISTTDSKLPTIGSGLDVKAGPNASTVAANRKQKDSSVNEVDLRSSRNIISTPAVEATKRRDVSLLLLVAKHGADLDAHDGDGLNPLHYAVLMGSISFVHILGRLGVNLNEPTNDSVAIPPIMLHISRKYDAKAKAVREALLAYGADPLKTDAEGNTVLHVAIKENNETFTRTILESITKAIKKTPMLTTSSLVAFKGKETLIRFGCSPLWVPGCFQDNERVLAVVPGHEPESKEVSGGEAADSVRLRLAVALLSSIFSFPKLSVEKLEAAGIKSVDQLSFATGNTLRSCCLLGFDQYKVPYNPKSTIQAAKKTLNEMFPQQKFSNMLSFPLNSITGIVMAANFNTENILNSSISKKATHLTEQERAELRLKHFGAEHLITDDASLVSKLATNDNVLLQMSDCWRQGSIVRVNKNGTFDVALFLGPVIAGCARTHIRLHPKPMCLDIVDQSLAARLVNTKNNNGEAPLDVLLEPFNFGSFENNSLTAMLLEAGAEVTEAQAKHARPETSIAKILAKAANMSPPELEAMDADTDIDRMESSELARDFSEAIHILEEAHKETYNDTPPPVNKNCELKSAGIRVLAVAEDGSNAEGFYDVTMTKVDIKGWPHGINDFYKMQIVQDTIKGLFILINNWGRIGDFYGGKHQQTPFSNRAEAVSEFEKVFRSKTGNSWSQRNAFVSVSKKYRLVHTNPRINNELELPCIAEIGSSLAHNLTEEVVDALKEFTDPSKIRNTARHIGLDVDCVSIGRLKMQTLLDAETILYKVKKALSKQKEISEQTTPDIPGLRDAMNEIALLSSQYYEMIPTKEGDVSIQPLDQNSLKSKFDLIHQLKDLTVASQVVIASCNAKNSATEHPFRYCLRALGTNLEPIQSGNLERTCIEQYFRNTCGSYQKDLFVRNVFKVKRAGADSAVKQEIENHRLLWHGTPTANIMGILRDGMRIAPPEASHSGMAFGRGIYCTDQFQKAFAYCRREGKDRVFLFLVDVALGNENEVTSAVYMEKPPLGFHSTVALGRTMPDPTKNVVIKGTGVSVPLGELVKIDRKSKAFCSWVENDFNQELDSEEMAKINQKLADPDTEYPATVPEINFENIANGRRVYDAKIELGPFASEVVLVERIEKQLSMDDAKVGNGGADQQRIIFQRRERSDVEDPVVELSEYIVYDESQVTIRYIIEIDSVASLRS